MPSWMPVTVTRLPGTITPATTQKAAWDGSPGTEKVPGDEGAPADPDGPAAADPLEGDVGSGGGQHLLGVGPGGHRLVDHGLPVGGDPGQQDGRLDLGAGHGGRVGDAPQGATGDVHGWQAPLPLPGHGGAHAGRGARPPGPWAGPAGSRPRSDGWCRAGWRPRRPAGAGRCPSCPGRGCRPGRGAGTVRRSRSSEPCRRSPPRRRGRPLRPGSGPRRRRRTARGRWRSPRPGRPAAGPGGRWTCPPAP